MGNTILLLEKSICCSVMFLLLPACGHEVQIDNLAVWYVLVKGKRIGMPFQVINGGENAIPKSLCSTIKAEE